MVTGAYSGTLHYAGAAGANAALNKVTYTTSGNAALVSTLGPDRGLLSVSVDGAPAQQFSTYAATQKMAQVIFNTNLPAGTHTVTVTVLGKKDPANSCTTTGCGTRVDVDAFALIK
jgi:hypothetical protein